MVTSEQRLAIKVAADTLRAFLKDHGAVASKFRRRRYNGDRVLEAITVDGRMAAVLVPNG